MSLKRKIIFRIPTYLLNSSSLNGSSPRLVYSRRDSGKCTGLRWRSPVSGPCPPAWRIQDTYNKSQITPIGQNGLTHIMSCCSIWIYRLEVNIKFTTCLKYRMYLLPPEKFKIHVLVYIYLCVWPKCK